MSTDAEVVISAQDRFSAVFAQATAGLGKVKQSAVALSGVLGGVVAGGFVGTLVSMVTSTVTLADELNKLAQRTGITVESLSAIRAAAELADVSTEEFTTGIRKLNLALIEAQDGTTKTAGIFRALGVDTTQGAENALRRIADAFTQLPDGATKAAVATEIFGRAGEKLIPLLNGGSRALDDARASAERYGSLLSTKLAAESEQFNDNLTKLKQSAGALGVAVGNQLVPRLLSFSDALLRLRDGGAEARKQLEETTNAATRLIAKLTTFRGGGPAFDAIANIAGGLLPGSSPEPGNVVTGVIGRPSTASPAPDPAALLRALAPARAADAGRAAGGLSMEDLMAQGAARRIAMQDANESAFNADADRQQRELLDFYADLALAQQLRIELAEQEGERAADSLQREAEAIKDRLDPTREYIRALERVAELQERGLLNDREAIAETNRLAEALRNNGKAAQDASNLGRDLGLTFTSAFEAAIGGSKSFRDILKGLESDLLKLGTRQLVTDPLFKSVQGLLGSATGGSGGGFGDIVSSLVGAIGFGGARASGGPVAAGMGYLVGEKGPELFVPRQSGGIVPNGAIGGMNVTVNVQARDVNSFRASESQIAASVAGSLARAQRRNG